MASYEMKTRSFISKKKIVLFNKKRVVLFF